MSTYILLNAFASMCESRGICPDIAVESPAVMDALKSKDLKKIAAALDANF